MADNGIVSRRQFIAGAAVTGTVVGLGAGGMVYAQQNGTSRFVLDGVTAGWEGVSPESISGVTNPTLNVVAGREYEIKWSNADGAPHNIAILSDNGEVLMRTPIISSGSQTLTFTASPKMAQYICQVHPSSMVGKLAVSKQGSGRQPTATPTAKNNKTGKKNATATSNKSQPTMTGNGTGNSSADAVTNVSDIAPDPAVTGPLGEREHRFRARLEPVDDVSSDASGMAYLIVYPSTGGWSKMVYEVTVENLDVTTVTGADIRLADKSGTPAVAPLYEPRDVHSGVRNNSSSWANVANISSEVSNVTNGSAGMENTTAFPATSALSWGLTLSYGNVLPPEFVGPLAGAPMIALVNEMNSGDAFVQVSTEAYPDGLLRGSIDEATYGLASQYD